MGLETEDGGVDGAIPGAREGVRRVVFDRSFDGHDVEFGFDGFDVLIEG